MFCLGLDVMGFRRFCEHTVRIAGVSVQGTAYIRPETPAPDFAPHITP
jgi:2-dehydro-3-deoxyglucarate aldolase/4-hydroxy-2-oxoheptanedioate aldolase